MTSAFGRYHVVDIGFDIEHLGKGPLTRSQKKPELDTQTDGLLEPAGGPVTSDSLDSNAHWRTTVTP